MVSYVVDEALRANMPFPSFSSCDSGLENYRPQPSELPSKFSNSQPPVDDTLSPSALIADVVRRSSVAHLFYSSGSTIRVGDFEFLGIADRSGEESQFCATSYWYCWEG
ncbi:hypothetical protein M405DRAFT_866389 [Rhizopogon salebrosus TDB-379]|nr:hypothetical protein M405DRAFT_866389 [Rhizopogon salebrosus TDB-379]